MPEAEPEGERLGRADTFLVAIGADVREGGDRACYVPAVDCIMLPPFGAFEGPEHYYATRLHETGHWTGHPSRLNRDLSGRFGSRSYAGEELVAELTAAFLCAELGIEGSATPSTSATGLSSCAPMPRRSSRPPARQARRPI